MNGELGHGVTQAFGRHQVLRPQPTDEQMALMYPTPHDHRIYGRGHGERVDATIALALANGGPWLTVADLSCGNAVIATAICAGTATLGDYAPGYSICGPIEETLDEIVVVEAFVLSETLEHVANPQLLLARIEPKAYRLVLTTPIEAWGDTNPEHLHAWDCEFVEFMLLQAGWTADAFTNVDSREYGEPYNYGIWVCS